MTTLELEELSDEKLIEVYREGHGQAIEVLVQRYKIFVRKKIKASYYIGADREDLIQEGMIGLFKAICDYNPDREAAFKSFATICIVRQISTAFKTATRQKHFALNTSISLSSSVGESEEDHMTLMDMIKDEQESNPEHLMIHQEEFQLLQEHIKESLSELEWEILMLHTQGRNYREISGSTGKSVKSIDNALQRIKRKLNDKKAQFC
ncbi:MAG: RNA polymerase sporulation sigma factor SigH [Cellulosilyticaceae bacterium]